MTNDEIRIRLQRAILTKKRLQSCHEGDMRSLPVKNLIAYCDETIKLCEKLLNFKERASESLDWMIKDMTWRFDQTKGNLDSGSQGGYSKELQAAIKLSKELEA